jgi:hypothetical protein
MPAEMPRVLSPSRGTRFLTIYMQPRSHAWKRGTGLPARYAVVFTID